MYYKLTLTKLITLVLSLLVWFYAYTIVLNEIRKYILQQGLYELMFGRGLFVAAQQMQTTMSPELVIISLIVSLLIAVVFYFVAKAFLVNIIPYKKIFSIGRKKHRHH